MRRLPRRWLAGLLAATVAFGVAFGAAATLGLTTDTLSADQSAVVSCDTSAAASYSTVYNATAGGYVVDQVTLSGLANACHTFDVKVTLAGAGGVALASVEVPAAGLTGFHPNMSLATSFAPASVLADDVVRIAVSITEWQ